jgi:hypothetical protein
MSKKITGVPVSLIQTDYMKQTRNNSGMFARWMLRGTEVNTGCECSILCFTLCSAFKLRDASFCCF